MEVLLSPLLCFLRGGGGGFLLSAIHRGVGSLAVARHDLDLGRLALGRLALGRLALGRLALGRLALVVAHHDDFCSLLVNGLLVHRFGPSQNVSLNHKQANKQQSVKSNKKNEQTKRSAKY